MNALIGFAELVALFALVFSVWLGVGLGLGWLMYGLARVLG